MGFITLTEGGDRVGDRITLVPVISFIDVDYLQHFAATGNVISHTDSRNPNNCGNCHNHSF
jgi:hypothetical protein